MAPMAVYALLGGSRALSVSTTSTIAVLVATVLVVWLRRLKASSQGLLACALALILAGALGNVIDRLRLGHVIDFIMVYWDEHVFPIFNVADCSISVGAGLLLLDAFLETRRSKVQGAGAESR
jgi:signal peptidase II